MGFEVLTAMIMKITIFCYISTCHLLSRWILLGLYFYNEDGGFMFLRNINWLSSDYMVLYPRR
jgi:hypothetical protein